MLRFYFDVNNGKSLYHDSVGDEFVDIEEARCQVQGILLSVIRDDLPEGDIHIVTCDLRDETGRIVYKGRMTYQGALDSNLGR